MSTKPIRGYNPSDIYIDDQPNFLAKNLAALKVLNQFNSLFVHHNVFVSVSRLGIYLGKFHRKNKETHPIVFTDSSNVVTNQFIQITVFRKFIEKDEPSEPKINIEFCVYEHTIKMKITAFIYKTQFAQKVKLKPINLCDLIR